jgi:hypothetical protein
MPVIEMEKEMTGMIASQKEQQGDFRLFKSHMNYQQLAECGLVPPLDSSIPSSPNGNYARLVYCYRPTEPTMNSAYQYLPTRFHISPSLIPFNTFVSWYTGIGLKKRFTSLVHFWKRRHDPNVMVIASHFFSYTL